MLSAILRTAERTAHIVGGLTELAWTIVYVIQLSRKRSR